MNWARKVLGKLRSRAEPDDHEPDRYRLAGMIHYSVIDETYVCCVYEISWSGNVLSLLNLTFPQLPPNIPDEVVIREELPLTQIEFGPGFSVEVVEPIEFGSDLFTMRNDGQQFADFILNL